MPREPNQQPFPGQRRVISTHREASSIPKGGTDTTWLYPSPQMFYNGAFLLPSAQAWTSRWSTAGYACTQQADAESTLFLQP